MEEVALPPTGRKGSTAGVLGEHSEHTSAIACFTVQVYYSVPLHALLCQYTTQCHCMLYCASILLSVIACFTVPVYYSVPLHALLCQYTTQCHCMLYCASILLSVIACLPVQVYYSVPLHALLCQYTTQCHCMLYCASILLSVIACWPRSQALCPAFTTCEKKLDREPGNEANCMPSCASILLSATACFTVQVYYSVPLHALLCQYTTQCHCMLYCASILLSAIVCFTVQVYYSVSLHALQCQYTTQCYCMIYYDAVWHLPIAGGRSGSVSSKGSAARFPGDSESISSMDQDSTHSGSTTGKERDTHKL